MSNIKILKAPTYEEARLNAELHAKPFDEDAIREFLVPRLKRMYIDYLEKQTKN